MTDINWPEEIAAINKGGERGHEQCIKALGIVYNCIKNIGNEKWRVPNVCGEGKCPVYEFCYRILSEVIQPFKEAIMKDEIEIKDAEIIKDKLLTTPSVNDARREA